MAGDGSDTDDAVVKEAPVEAELSNDRPSNYLKGPRLSLITGALCMCLFLTNIEIPIVTTSIVGITNDLQGFSQSSWIVSAYLLGYVGFLIVWAKLSDIFGRKTFLLAAASVFLIFSAACGGAQTITQLIIFRAFQGVGGAGNYALCTTIFLELVPPEKYAAYTSSISIVFAISLLVGPIIGGAINSSSTWRWVFLFNVPAIVPAILVIAICIPNNFPYHGQTQQASRYSSFLSTHALKRVDFVGAAMLLVATLFLVAALQEAGLDYQWNSGFVIALLTISGVTWIAFLVWERRTTMAATKREPVFPWRFIQNRVWLGMLLNAIFLGAPWFATIFQLPQRFQIVNGASDLEAGIHLMPFTFASPVGSVIAAIVAKKIPPIYLVLFASILQVVGFALLTTIPFTLNTIPAMYGYEVIAGFGIGINITLLILMTPFSVEKRDHAVAMGAVTQFRLMGGAIGLAIVTTVLRGYVTANLSGFLSQDQITLILQSSSEIAKLDPDTQFKIKGIYANGYTLEMKILCGFAAGQVLTTLIMWQKKQLRVA